MKGGVAMREAVIVSGARTAVGNFGGTLRDVKAADLGALVIKEAIKRAGLRPIVTEFLKGCRPKALGSFDKTELQKKFYDYDKSLTPIYFNELIMGNVLQAGQGMNPGRQAGVFAGLPEETNAFTVNKVCGSGMKAIALAAQAIVAGRADVVLAGGMESMSNAPYSLPCGRWGYRMDMPYGQVVDLMVFDGLYDIFYGHHMGVTAENIAALYQISRREQDEFSLLSHQRARHAIASGRVADEIIPVVVPQKKKDPIVFKEDERPMDTDMVRMSKMMPAFKKDGTVTAGNSSGLNDGAAAVVIMASEMAKDLGLKPLAKIRGYELGGVDPDYMGLGPIPAVNKLLSAQNLVMKDIDLVELNEAFAVQALACVKELEIPMEKLNVNGGGVSIGHPIGCTGTRITYSLAMEMKKRNLRLGIATLCIGGGQGMAILLENIE